ncbi:glycosyltransferase [Photobacterium aquimaris]|uniref:Glycosyl hydrolase family 1 n=1 Tax=Photobacterium aquimaris TaxID=512643 RepID=A0A2T3HSI8_9GAMM|nr:glycosyltransferase [Photobacterium aquimaris]OBU24878.1 hypothetical protein AYY21_10260 [Photobacterium aquimaris]PQJ41671.1 hypothetical protein BTN98_08655 [Photobacterium aquimaris]PST95966.1 glycosyl hydrolase family 1 [Photobacterium aquimaris]
MKIVISGVNLVEAGPLKIFKEAINAFSNDSQFEVICLVNNKRLFSDCKKINVKFLEYPLVKTSWLKRIFFEYKTCNEISKRLAPDIWLAMHDMSPRVNTPLQLVYCHNASPFYKASIKELKYERKLLFFSLFYKWLYKINIKSNKAIIVQQEWIGKYLVNDLGARDYIVSKPVASLAQNDVIKNTFPEQDSVIFFFPALARTFKNFEIILNALSYLKIHDRSTYQKIKVILTINENSNIYARKLINKYKNIENINFIGPISYEDVVEQYKSCDVVLFPSKLETWGLPISEAKEFSKPIILVDLPYAYETLGNYSSALFIEPNDYIKLADIMTKIVAGEKVFNNVNYNDNDASINSWSHLVRLIKKMALDK